MVYNQEISNYNLLNTRNNSNDPSLVSPLFNNQ